MMSALSGAPVSTGFVPSCPARPDTALTTAGFEEELKAALREQEVLGTDETPAPPTASGAAAQPFISLNALTGYRPAPEACNGSTPIPSQGSAPASGVLPAGVRLHLLEIQLQAIQPLPCRTDPLTRHPVRLGMTASFLACYFPHIAAAFRRRVSHRIQRYMPPVSPHCTGYITLRLMAQVGVEAFGTVGVEAGSRRGRGGRRSGGRGPPRWRGQVLRPGGEQLVDGLGAGHGPAGGLAGGRVELFDRSTGEAHATGVRPCRQEIGHSRSHPASLARVRSAPDR